MVSTVNICSQSNNTQAHNHNASHYKKHSSHKVRYIVAISQHILHPWDSYNSHLSTDDTLHHKHTLFSHLNTMTVPDKHSCTHSYYDHIVFLPGIPDTPHQSDTSHSHKYIDLHGIFNLHLDISTHIPHLPMSPHIDKHYHIIVCRNVWDTVYTSPPEHSNNVHPSTKFPHISPASHDNLRGNTEHTYPNTHTCTQDKSHK